MDDLLLVPTRNVHHSEKYKDFWFSEKPKTKTRFLFFVFWFNCFVFNICCVSFFASEMFDQKMLPKKIDWKWAFYMGKTSVFVKRLVLGGGVTIYIYIYIPLKAFSTTPTGLVIDVVSTCFLHGHERAKAKPPKRSSGLSKQLRLISPTAWAGGYQSGFGTPCTMRSSSLPHVPSKCGTQQLP